MIKLDDAAALNAETVEEAIRIANDMLDTIRAHQTKAAPHFLIVPHTVKAATPTKWVTLPNGARIPIGGSGGAAKQEQGQQQEQSKPQAKPTESDKESESQGNAGEGLTHAQRTQIATKVASKLGIDPDTVQVAEQDESDENGVKAGEYSPADGKITIFPASFSSKEELIGTLSHEASHQKLDAVLKQYNEQRALFQDGESLQSDKVSTFREMKQVFDENSRATYALADGVSKYSTLFWDRYNSNPTTSTYTAAISETLAETARLTQTGKGDNIHSQMKSLFNRVNRLAGGV